MPENVLSILIISGVRGDTRRYRAFHLYEQTRLLGLDSQLSHITDSEIRNKADRADVVILHRAPFDRQISQLERDIHQKGGLLIQDIDDLLFEPEAFKYIHSVDFSDPVRASLYQEDMRLYRKTVEACDAVITSTGYLAERIRLLGKPVRVHRNAFSREMLESSERSFRTRQISDKGIVIGYASGTATHDQDFALIKPALKSILNRFPTAELRLVGPVDPGADWGNLASRIHRRKLVPWRILPDVLVSFDINLAPLRTDNPFGQSKSEIKYVEAALVKVPTIASPTDAFKYAIRQADNGFLASDTLQWENYLETLILQPELRRLVGEDAYQDVLQRYHPDMRAGELEGTLSVWMGRELNLPPATSVASKPEAGSVDPFWSCAQAERSPSLLQMGWYTLRYRGLFVLLKQVWIFLRRWVSPLIPFRRID